MDQFKLTNGDLSLSNGNYDMVTGSDKLVQDLGVATQFPYQADPYHPRYGSIMQSFIGKMANNATSTLVVSEMMRIINNYMSVKMIQLRTAVNAGQTSPFSPEELISDVKSVDVIPYQDTFVVSSSLVLYSTETQVLVAVVSSS
jgi:hypothetical protein